MTKSGATILTDQASNISPQSFGWLHLTDLHVGMQNQDWLWPTLKSALFEDLAKAYQLSGGWDLVIFSGDLVQSGTKPEYEKLNAILSELWQRFAELGCSPELVVLPGNHDLKRPQISSAVRTLRRWWDEPDVQAEFFADRNNEYRLTIDKMFEQYSNWISDAANLNFRIKTGKPGLLPGDQSYIIERGGLRIGIVALNSTWLQINNEDFKGQLHVDVKQLLAVTDNDADRWCAQNDLNLLLTHQPPDWLHEQSLEYWLGEINPPGRFAAHIFGHMHEAAARLGSSGGAAPRIELQGISTFGLTKVRGKFDRSHGYSAVRFHTSDKGTLQIWPRKSYPAAAGGYNIASENAFKLDLDQSFRLPLNLRGRAITQQAEAQLNIIPHVGSIQDSLSELEISFLRSPAHANVRNVEQKLTIDALKNQKACWIVAEWGLGEDGFIGTVKSKSDTEGHRLTSANS
ncbi:putative MPP superfamily phosphohydrolase [Bradyrhizobium sp. LB8.2]